MLILDVKKQIDSESGLAVLRANIEISTSTISGLYGSSGQGKSTLFNMISGIVKPDHGTISFNGKIWHSSKEQVSIKKRNIGYIFQGNSLFSHFNVKQNVLFALSKEERKEFNLSPFLEQLGLSKMINRYPHELSGGQLQRVAIARALAQKAQLILMDEPFTGLDIENKHRLYKELETFQKRYNLTIIIITHDVNDIYYLCDKVYRIENHTVQPAITNAQFREKIEERISRL